APGARQSLVPRRILHHLAQKRLRMPPLPADIAKSRPAADAPDIAAVAAELVACGSLEMGADAPEDAQRIASLLPAGTPVYVNHLPPPALAPTPPALVALSEAGLEPVPHVAARRIASRVEAQSFLKQAVRLASVRKVLLIGGDVAEPLGPYGDAAAFMRDHLLPESGVQQVAHERSGIAIGTEGLISR